MRYSKDELAKTLLITHKHCPDGCGCAVIFRAAGGPKENVKYVTAGRGVGAFFKKNVDYINSFDKILIADVAPDKDAAQKIEKEFGHVYVLDHHKTALHLKGRDWCHISMEKCGTYLLYDHMFGEFDSSAELVGEQPLLKAALNNFAVLVNDRDMWLRQHRKANEMSMLMDFLGTERYVNRAMKDYFAFEWEPHEREVLDILAEKKEEYIEEKVAATRIVEKEGKKFGYLMLSQHQSDVLNRVLEVHDVDVAVGVLVDKGMVSLRSGDTYDSSEFCKRYGGGGHARASGHPISRETIEDIMELIHH